MSFGRTLVQPVLQFFDPTTGAMLASGTVTFYAAGTTTLQTVYSDSALTTALPNPVTLNSSGQPQTGSGAITPIYLQSLSYKVVLANSLGVTLWTADNLGGSPGLDAAGTAFTGTTATLSGLLDLSATTAGQIAFPATQNASSNANTLDDYEEGSWTPTITGSTSASGQVYSHQVGRYQKVGNRVHLEGYILLSTLGTITGAVEIGGLPFALANVANYNVPVLVSYWTGMTSTFVSLGGLASSSGTVIVLKGVKTAATAVANLAQSDLSNATELAFAISYQASQ